MAPRVGVFVCRCGTNIGGVVDVPAVVTYAGDLEGVVFADEGDWICSADNLSRIKEEIRARRLERVVIASCTPRTHETLFKNAVKEADLNPYLMEFVSLREQSSWVHKSVPAAATSKAKELVRMGVAKALLLEPAEERQIPVGRSCLVIGGGVAGMTAAIAVARQGFSVHLVERGKRLGGMLNELGWLAPFDIECRLVVERKIEEIAGCDSIKVHTGTVVESVSGFVGNYKIRLTGDSSAEIDISQIIVATGMKDAEPEGLYGYGTHPGIVTLLELERRLRGSEPMKGTDVAIIQCVGSRNRDRGCCNIGCLAAIRSAKTLKEIDPSAQVTLFYRDLNVQGEDVHYVRWALDTSDIRTVRFDPSSPPDVAPADAGRLVVVARDVLLGEEVRVGVGLVALTSAFRGDPSTEELKGLLKVSTNDDGFFHEAHVKLAPLDFPTDGIYLCGAARSPKGVRWAMEEALGASMRASIPMRRGYVEAPGIVSKIDFDRCVWCGVCGEVCAFGAIEIERESPKKKIPRVIEALCKGCGVCAAECPTDAIQIVHYSDAQIEAQVEAALAEEPGRKIVAFCCHWCALGAVDLAAVNRSEYPPHARIIRVLCAGRVDKDWIRKSLDEGAAGVLVAGCEFPTCHYINGNVKCEERVRRLKKKLAKEGYDADRVWNVWLSAADGPKLVATMQAMTEALGLG